MSISKKNCLLGFLKIQAAILLVVFVNTAQAQVSDTLYTQSGFRAVGEIREVSGGEITLETELFGTVKTDLNDLATIISELYFDVITTSGAKHYAQLRKGSESGKVVLYTGSEELEIEITELYSMERIEEEWVERLKANFLAGLNYTKATENLQINWGFDLSYRSYVNNHSLTYDGLFTESPAGTFRRQNLVYNYGRNFSAGLFLFGAAEAQSNTQLQLKLRGQASAGIGKNFFQDRNRLLALVIALNSNNELPLEGEGFSSIETLIGYRFRHSNLIDGKMNISSNLSYYRAITNVDRDRIDFDVRLSWKVYGNFSLSATYFSNYDSRVVQTLESRNDYAITLAANYRL